MTIEQTLIISIGNGGCNITDTLCGHLPDDVKVVQADTEPDDLECHKAEPLLLNREDEDLEAVRRLLSQEIKRVYIVACLGGITGSHFTPLIAQLVKEAGINPCCVVTTPFAFEGKKKERANTSLEMIRQYADNVHVIDNNDFMSQYPDVDIPEAFQLLDKEVEKIVSEYLKKGI